MKIDIRDADQVLGQRNRVPFFVDGDPKRIDAAHLLLPSSWLDPVGLLISDTECVIKETSKGKRETEYMKKVSSMSSDATAHWTFLTNHAQVLLCIANDPDVRLRDVAETVGITERAAQRIVVDLAEAGFLERERRGRRNSYLINEKTEMRHPAQKGYAIGELLDLLHQVRSSRDRAKQVAE